MATVDATKIHQAPGKLWLKVPVPPTGHRLIIDASGNPSSTFYAWAATTAYVLGQMIVDSNGNLEVVTVAGTSGGTAPTWLVTVGGTVTDGTVTWELLLLNAAQFAGATAGAVTTTLTPKVEELMADQVSAPIDVIETQEAAEIDVTLMQSDLLNLSNFIVHGTYATGTDTGLPANLQAYEEIAFGGILAIPRFSVAAISRRRDNVQKFVVSQLYAAYQAEAVKLPTSRAKATEYAVKFKGIAIPTRPEGDQVGKVYRQT